MVSAAGAPFVWMAERDTFGGFGYIGGRQLALADGHTADVAAADAYVLAAAERLGWDTEQLYTWANSRLGRWFADTAFSGGGELADRLARCDREQLIRTPPE